MGIYEKPSAAFLDALTAEFGFVPPRDPGYDTVEAIRAMRDGEVDVFIGMGGNFASASPDTEVTAAALARCRLTVQVSTKLNRSHVEVGEAALILPCLGRTEIDRTGGREQHVTVEDSMSMVHRSQGNAPPASAELRSEVAIVCGLAGALFPGDANVDWPGFERDYDRIRDSIARVVPGFERFNERVARPGGFRLPHPVNDGRFAGGGRALLTVNPFTEIEGAAGSAAVANRALARPVQHHDLRARRPLPRHPSGGRRVVFVNPVDLAALDLADGDIVDVVSEFRDGVERRATRFRLVGYPTAAGTCAAYFPEANVLVPLDSTADGSGTPTSKSIVVRFEPVGWRATSRSAVVGDPVAVADRASAHVDGASVRPARDAAEEVRVAEAEHAAVGRGHPVALALFRCGHVDDRLIELDVAGRSVELRVAEREDAAVGGDQPVALVRAGGAMPTIGWLRRIAPVEPWNRASPKEKMPPSEATNQ